MIWGGQEACDMRPLYGSVPVSDPLNLVTLSMPAITSTTVWFRLLMLVRATYVPFSQWAVQLCTVVTADAVKVYILWNAMREMTV